MPPPRRCLPAATEWPRPVPQAQWIEGVFSGTHGSAWDAEGNLYVQDWNVDGRIMKLVRVSGNRHGSDR